MSECGNEYRYIDLKSFATTNRKIENRLAENKLSYIDSHCHLHYEWDPGKQDVKNDWKRNFHAAIDNGVVRMMVVATSLTEKTVLTEIINYANSINEGVIDISLGSHPLEDEDIYYDAMNDKLKTTCDFSNNSKTIFKAIGETGFDLNGDLILQEKKFIVHAELAKKYNIPIILHSRGEGEKFEAIVRAALSKFPEVRGVFHCFCMSQSMADFAQQIGWKISFSGILTFKNAIQLKEIAKNIDSSSILIETDSPFLAPVPFRGKPNNPENVKYVNSYLAKLRGIDESQLCVTIYDNYCALFHQSN